MAVCKEIVENILTLENLIIFKRLPVSGETSETGAMDNSRSKKTTFTQGCTQKIPIGNGK